MAFCSGLMAPPLTRFISIHSPLAGTKRSGMPGTTPSAFNRPAEAFDLPPPLGIAKMSTSGWNWRNQRTSSRCSSCSVGMRPRTDIRPPTCRRHQPQPQTLLAAPGRTQRTGHRCRNAHRCGNTWVVQPCPTRATGSGTLVLVVWFSFLFPSLFKDSEKLAVHFVIDGVGWVAVAHLHADVVQARLTLQVRDLGQISA